MSGKTFIQFEAFIDYVESLKERVAQDSWDKPIAPGKWTLKELLCHLWNWDVYSMERMIPLMKDGAQLPAFEDFDSVNHEAIEKAKSFHGIDDLIHEFAQTRREMIKKLEEIYDPSMRFTIRMEQGDFSIDRYVDIFVHHDGHHKKQIEDLGI